MRRSYRNFIFILFLLYFSNLALATKTALIDHPTLEGHKRYIVHKVTFLQRMKELTGISDRFYERLYVDAGEELSLNIGGTIVTPYYAKLLYLLDPTNAYSPYYLVSLGVNYVDEEDISVGDLAGDLRERLNYGIGVGVEFNSFVIEILYGKYNYDMLRVRHNAKQDEYNATKLTLNFKVRM